MADSDRPALSEDPRAALARVIYDALKTTDPDAFTGTFEIGDEEIFGEVERLRVTVDGRFDLLAVADQVLSHMPESK